MFYQPNPVPSNLRGKNLQRLLNVLDFNRGGGNLLNDDRGLCTAGACVQWVSQGFIFTGGMPKD